MNQNDAKQLEFSIEKIADIPAKFLKFSSQLSEMGIMTMRLSCSFPGMVDYSGSPRQVV